VGANKRVATKKHGDPHGSDRLDIVAACTKVDRWRTSRGWRDDHRRRTAFTDDAVREVPLAPADR
jgi:hypothetical protein